MVLSPSHNKAGGKHDNYNTLNVSSESGYSEEPFDLPEPAAQYITKDVGEVNVMGLEEGECILYFKSEFRNFYSVTKFEGRNEVILSKDGFLKGSHEFQRFLWDKLGIFVDDFDMKQQFLII